MSKKKIKELSRDDHIRFHEQWLQPLMHSLEVLRYQTNHPEQILSQLDFHLLLPHLFPKAGDGSKPIFLHVREWLPRALARQKEMGLLFVITGPTFIEFLDQLNHQSDAVKRFLTQQIDRIDLGLESLDEHAFASSDILRHWLSILTEGGFTNAIQKPIQTLNRLVETGTIRGIGDFDFLPEKDVWKRYRKICDQVFERQCELRLEHDRFKRSDKDSRFHYRVDAANMCISKILQQESKHDLFFFTRTQFSIRWLSGLALSDQSLPALLRMTELEDNHEDRISHITDAIAFIIENLQQMRRKISVVDFPSYLYERLYYFYNNLLPRIFAIEKTACGTSEEVNLEEIKELVSHKEKLQDGMERAIAEIRSGGKSIAAKLADSVHLDVWDDFDLSADPVYQKIRAEFML